MRSVRNPPGEDLASELEMQTLDMIQPLDALHQILSKLTELLPEDGLDSGT